jgi:ketosteroid isomerase-like protein
MSEIQDLIAKFTKAVEANDGKGLAALFTPDGTYVDYFFGPYQGPEAIAGMLAHFHEDARDYKWTFFDPISDGKTAYARYMFSYVSKMKDSAGRAVVFEGMSCFKLQNGKIAHYSEVFDRGSAMAQLDFSSERMKKSLTRFAQKQNVRPEASLHAERVKKLGASTV